MLIPQEVIRIVENIESHYKHASYFISSDPLCPNTPQPPQWMILSLDKNIPTSLLLLSRVSTLPAGHSVTYEDLRRAVAHLPDSLVCYVYL